MITWQEQLSLMQLVATRYPHLRGRPIAMTRRGKRGRDRPRPPNILAIRIAAAAVVREGEKALVDRDGRRRLAPHQVYDMRIRALRLERDDALAAAYSASQSSATRAIDGDTYQNVPFPIRVTHPDVPVEIYYPYHTAITILAAAPIGQQFAITTQTHTPRLRIAGLLRLADRALTPPPPPPPHTPDTPTPPAPTPPTVTPHPPAQDAHARQRDRRRRFG